MTLHQPMSRQKAAAIADDMLDDVFEDLETTLKRPTIDEEDFKAAYIKSAYPYTRQSPESQTRSIPWMLVGALGALAFSGGVLWWGWGRLSQGPITQTADSAQPFPQDFAGVDADSTLATLGSGLDLDSLLDSLTPIEEPAPSASEDAIPSSDAASGTTPPPPAQPQRAIAPPAPQPAPVSPVYSAAPPASANSPEMKLVGIVGDSTPIALIMVDNVMRQVAAGQAIQRNWHVASIGEQAVNVSNGQRGFTLQLGLKEAYD